MKTVSEMGHFPRQKVKWLKNEAKQISPDDCPLRLISRYRTNSSSAVFHFFTALFLPVDSLELTFSALHPVIIIPEFMAKIIHSGYLPWTSRKTSRHIKKQSRAPIYSRRFNLTSIMFVSRNQAGVACQRNY